MNRILFISALTALTMTACETRRDNPSTCFSDQECAPSRCDLQTHALVGEIPSPPRTLEPGLGRGDVASTDADTEPAEQRLAYHDGDVAVIKIPQLVSKRRGSYTAADLGARQESSRDIEPVGLVPNVGLSE